MIDIGLFILMIILGVASFLMGWVFCALFHNSNNKDEDLIHPCETIDDIIKREG